MLEAVRGEGSYLGGSWNLSATFKSSEPDWRPKLAELGEDLAKYSEGVKACVMIASKLGLDETLSSEISNAVNYGMEAAKLASAIATSNPVAALGAVAGLMGVGAPDPEAERHAEVMSALNEIKRLQMETLRRLDQIESKIDELRSIVVRNSQSNLLQLNYIVSVLSEERLGNVYNLRETLKEIAFGKDFNDLKYRIGAEPMLLGDARKDLANLLAPTNRAWWRMPPSGQATILIAEELTKAINPLVRQLQTNDGFKDLNLGQPYREWDQWLQNENQGKVDLAARANLLDDICDPDLPPLDPYKVILASEAVGYNEMLRPILDQADNIFKEGKIDGEAVRFNMEHVSVKYLQRARELVEFTIASEYVFSGVPFLRYLLEHPIPKEGGSISAESWLTLHERLAITPLLPYNFARAFVRTRMKDSEKSLTEYLYSYSSGDANRLLGTLGPLPDGWTLKAEKTGDQERFFVRTSRGDKVLFSLPVPADMVSPEISYGPSLPLLIQIRERLAEQLAMSQIVLERPDLAAILRDQELVAVPLQK